MAGEVDEIATAFSLEVARESAWESAVALANARSDVERKRVERLIGARASVLSRLLLGPVAEPDDASGVQETRERYRMARALAGAQMTMSASEFSAMASKPASKTGLWSPLSSGSRLRRSPKSSLVRASFSRTFT